MKKLSLVPALGLLALALQGCEGEAARPAALKVKLASAAQATVEEKATFDAFLAASETVEIRPKVRAYLLQQLFNDGALVEKGATLYKLDDRELAANYAAAKENASKAETAWKNDTVVRDRYVALAAKGAISEQIRDNAVAKAAEAQAAFNAAKSAQDKAAVDLGYAVIAAPITGYISRSNVDAGALAEAGGEPLATMYRIDPIRAEFSISDRDFYNFSRLIKERGAAAKAIKFRLELGDERLPYKHEGVLEMADPVIDAKTNAVGVRVEFPNPDGELRPGMFANITGVLGAREATTAPEAAVLDWNGGKAVFIVDENGLLAAVPVKTGAAVGDDRVILEGLSPGQKVVVEGLVAAQPGMRAEVAAQ